MAEPVLVIGATGNQGGAVVRHLLANGLPVRAMVRDPGRAVDLGVLGAELCTGDLDDPESVLTAMQGCKVVFAATTPYAGGADIEIRQGKTIADAASVSGVHLVYSGVGTSGRPTGLPQLDSKRTIEAHIRELGLPYTVLGPTFFMENF